MKESIAFHLEAQKQKIIDDIQTLISIESVHGNQEGNLKALQFVMQKAAKMGISCHLTQEKDALLATIGSGVEKIGVLVHVDVVEVGDIVKWKYPPFSGFFDGEFIWGRGSLDDKGAVIASLYVLKTLLDLHIPLNKQIWLIIGTGEEGGDWTDIAHFKRDFGVPDYGFSPDGDFPIFNEENGYADMLLEFTEPGLENIITLQAGGSPNVIPSTAVIQFKGEPQMDFQGVAAHSSTPELGENAIENLCRELSPRKKLNFIRFVNQYLAGDPSGGKLGLTLAEKENSNPVQGRTVCVPTLLRLTPTGVRLNINIRHAFGVTKEHILRQFEDHAAEFGYTVKMKDYLPPLRVDSNHEVLQLMKSVYEEYGFKNSFEVGYGTSYAKSMENFVSWGPNFPDVINCAHMENEKISLNSLLCAAQMYTLFLVRCMEKSHPA